MIGTKTYLDLLIELSSILDTKDFYILINHQGLNYRIKGIYDLDLNKLKYPKKFRKSIYDAEPELLYEAVDEYGRVFLFDTVMRRIDGCLLYRVILFDSCSPYINPYINITPAYETVKKINNLDIDFTCTDEEIRYVDNYFLQAPLFDTNRIEAFF